MRVGPPLDATESIYIYNLYAISGKCVQFDPFK